MSGSFEIKDVKRENESSACVLIVCAFTLDMGLKVFGKKVVVSQY